MADNTLEQRVLRLEKAFACLVDILADYKAQGGTNSDGSDIFATVIDDRDEDRVTRVLGGEDYP